MADQVRRVVLVTNELGLGGTAKILVEQALAHDRSRFAVDVVALQEGGVRQRALEDAGVRVDVVGGDLGRLVERLAGADVVHVHRSGHHEPLLPEAVRRSSTPVLVETNVFGQRDASADEALIDCHLFVSKMCALRYRGRAGKLEPEFHRRHRVLYNSFDLERLRALAPSPSEAKRRLGLDPDRPVVGRLGRADDRKWRNLLVDMVPPLLELAPEAQIMFVGATAAKLRRLRGRGVLDRVHVRAPDSAEEAVATMYAACDVVVNAAVIGESFGLAIAEPMALGRPVVTCSTPHVDNAQVELVDEGVTGHVANHPRQFAEAVAALLGDRQHREVLGRAGRAKADALWDVHAATRQVESLYSSLLVERAAPSQWRPSPAEIDAFEAEYALRARTQFRPLRVVERLAVARVALAERAAWKARAAAAVTRTRASALQRRTR